MRTIDLTKNDMLDLILAELRDLRAVIDGMLMPELSFIEYLQAVERATGFAVDMDECAGLQEDGYSVAEAAEYMRVMDLRG